MLKFVASNIRQNVLATILFVCLGAFAQEKLELKAGAGCYTDS